MTRRRKTQQDVDLWKSEGREAHAAGKVLKDNPYKYDVAASLAWTYGWVDGMREELKEGMTNEAR